MAHSTGTEIGYMQTTDGFYRADIFIGGLNPLKSIPHADETKNGHTQDMKALVTTAFDIDPYDAPRGKNLRTMYGLIMKNIPITGNPEAVETGFLQNEKKGDTGAALEII